MIEFIVYGKPQPRGSKAAVVIPKHGGGWVTTANGRPVTAAKDTNPKSKDWMASVSAVAAEHFSGDLIAGPVRLSVQFYLARPKCHFGTGKNSGALKSVAPQHHIQKPDTDKLLRCVQDALKGVVWRDDCQVIGYFDTWKSWTTQQERAVIRIEPI